MSSQTNQGSRKRTRTIEVPENLCDEVVAMLAQLMVNENNSSLEEREETRLEDEEKYGSCDNGDTAEYEISRVVDHRVTSAGEWEFLIKFKNFCYPEWIPDRDCDCESSIREYLRKKDLQIQTVYLVCRVSSKNQTGPKHVSLQAQETLLRQTAKEMFGNACRVKLIKISASAYKNIPNALVRLGKVLVNGDNVLIYRVDRLSRNIVKFLSFLENLNNRGVHMFAQDEKLWYHSQKLDFIQGILDANKEAFVISKRVKLSIEHRRQRGDESLGSVEYGYKLVRRAGDKLIKVENPVEQKVIKRTGNERRGGRSFEEIATLYNSQGILKRGRKWNAKMVKFIVGK